MHFSRRAFFGTVLLLLLPVPTFATDSGWLPASPEKLPRWRGFNLQNKFDVHANQPFEEADFRMIHDLGFNFVRLPMDYRIWIVGGDWTKIDGNALKDIDQAVAWGEKYHVHICLNFHRAPGYTVAQPPEARSLWTDEEAQRVCALHWATFARRYKGIPNERLSFDLFNEPANIDPQIYAKVVGRMAEAIHKEDPNRLIIADGLSWGTKPCAELVPLHVAQATRGYAPMELTHYQASWIAGSDGWPVPTWPMGPFIPTFLYGPGRADLHSPLTLTGAFPVGTRIDLKVKTVSDRARLVVRADDAVVLDKAFISGPESKEGEKVVYVKEYNVYQNVLNQSESIVLSRAASRITISNGEGDWLTLDSVALQPAGTGATYVLPTSSDWGQKQVSLVFDPSRPGSSPWSGGEVIDREWLWQHDIVPWQGIEAQGVGVMVGEWGAFDKTPHDVVMRWMEDNLANFKKANWGWALWEFHGSFGIMDSNRADVTYEDYHGHKLDRQMLELLQRY
jgi:aryl-phospho-beta-D-glucosidase BglC (GH1 family)